MDHIKLMVSNNEIAACYPVMAQLRPHITEADFLPRVRLQMEDGYRLAAVSRDDEVVSVAGFRLGENLAWGRFLYVDDLVTDQALRSSGYGQNLLGWLANHGRELGCTQMHLDSGLQREDAHRFYQRHDMDITGYHFAIPL